LKLVVLAAGKGERFYPFSLTRPKPMMQVLSKPILEWVLRRAKEAGFDEAIIVVGPLGSRIKAYLKDGRRLGMRIEYVEQSRPLGTADAVIKAFEKVKDDVLIVYGDLLLERGEILGKVKEEMQKEELVVATVEVKDYGRYPAAIVKDGYVEKLMYQPRPWEFAANRAMIGIIGMRRRIIEEYLDITPPLIENTPVGIAPPHEKDLFETIYIAHRDGVKVRSVDVKHGWYDVDKPWDPLIASYLMAEWEAKKIKESQISSAARIEEGVKMKGVVIVEDDVVIKDGTVIKGPVWIGRETTVNEYSYIIGPVSTGERCVIGPFSRLWGAFLGREVRVEHCADVCGAVVLDSTFIVHWSHVSGVIGERCDFGAGTICGTLRFDDKEVQVMVRGRLESTGLRGFGVIMGDYSRTGVGVLIHPGRIIGPYSMVGPGVVVRENIKPFTAVLLKEQKLETRPWGPEIYEGTRGWLDERIKDYEKYFS